MSNPLRFGKRLALPSTAEIKHELRLMQAADRVLEVFARRAEVLGDSNTHDDISANEISKEHGLTIDCAQRLIDRIASQ